MNERTRTNKRIAEGFEMIIDEAGSAVKSVLRSGAETLGGNVRGAIQRALSRRREVVMVRVNGETLARLDELIEAGLMNSRSEASAFLIAEGIDARRDLFASISERIGKIRDAKRELVDLLHDPFEQKADEAGIEQQEGIREPTISAGVRQLPRGSTHASMRGSSPNDQRSNVMNPNNPASNAAANNRSNQMNPNNSAYRASRGNRR